MILVQVSGPAVDGTGVAEGFSGSPVYCPDGMGGQGNIGAISEGIGQYGNNVVLVTPIQQMLGEPVTPPSSAPRLAVRPHPLSVPLTIGGLSPAIFGVVQRAAALPASDARARRRPRARSPRWPICATRSPRSRPMTGCRSASPGTASAARIATAHC
jgi:hypothetical protein